MSKEHPDLDGTMESEGGSEKEYDERILDEDFERKGKEGESDGDDESESSESVAESGKGYADKNAGERSVHIVSPEPDAFPERTPVAGNSNDPVAGNSKDAAPGGGKDDGGFEPVAGKSTDGIPDTGSKKKATEKGVSERKGESERKDESENELEI